MWSTVLATFAVYMVFTPGPNPGQTWHGLLRYLTLTQIYTDDYLVTYLHRGCRRCGAWRSRCRSTPRCPALAYLLLRRSAASGRPARHAEALAALAAVTPVWLVDRHHHRFAAEFGRHVAARPTRVLRRRHGVGGTWRSRRTLARPRDTAVGRCAVSGRRDAARRRHPRSRSGLGAAHEGASLRGHRHARGGHACARLARPVHADARQPTDGVARRDLLRDLPGARGRHGGRHESRAEVAPVHRLAWRVFMR